LRCAVALVNLALPFVVDVVAATEVPSEKVGLVSLPSAMFGFWTIQELTTAVLMLSAKVISLYSFGSPSPRTPKACINSESPTQDSLSRKRLISGCTPDIVEKYK
jgi:hypothetical protein